MGKFFKKAFQDMKESAKAQHEVDKANFEAAKAESRQRPELPKLRPGWKRQSRTDIPTTKRQHSAASFFHKS